MGMVVQARNGRHQLRLDHALLPRRFFWTFATAAEATAYGAQLLALLDGGVVPAELVQRGAAPKDALLPAVIRTYLTHGPVTTSDQDLLGVVVHEVLGVRVSAVTWRWADGYVRGLKERRLTPGTIRKRVGVLARVLDWHLRRNTPQGGAVPANPLRQLERGYSVYTQADGHSPRRDTTRDRRLTPAESARIDAALAGHKRADRERTLPHDPAFALLVALILGTGLRLREAYRLRVADIDLVRGVLRVGGSKGHRGVLKPRVVPLVPALRARLAAWCDGRVGLLLPFWDGDPASQKATTNRLSQRFRTLLDYADVPDCTEHDLRHEATCRWLELRRPDGAWVLSELEVVRIMGWSDPRMILRYASIRGEDLADRLVGLG